MQFYNEIESRGGVITEELLWERLRPLLDYLSLEARQKVRDLWLQQPFYIINRLSNNHEDFCTPGRAEDSLAYSCVIGNYVLTYQNFV